MSLAKGKVRRSTGGVARGDAGGEKEREKDDKTDNKVQPQSAKLEGVRVNKKAACILSVTSGFEGHIWDPKNLSLVKCLL